MKPFIEFLRRQLFLLLCAVGGLVGIVLIFTGLQQMPKITEEMKGSEEVYRGLEAVRTQPVNEKGVDAATERFDRIKENLATAVSKAKTLQDYKPLVEGVFPAGNSDKLFEFRMKYGDAMKELMKSLNPGEPATQRDIDVMTERIKNEQYEQERQKQEGALVATESIGKTTPAGVLTKEGAKQEPEARAHLAAAQRTWVYAVDVFDARPPERVASLQFEPVMKEKESVKPPTLEQCWWSQVGYWIQKDVVDAIVSLNTEAADVLLQRDESPWVGIMPVKDLISIRLSPGYMGDKGDAQLTPAAPGGNTEAKPVGGPEVSFTQTTSTDSYEAVQFTVKLVMDQRDLLRFVERVSSNRFHNCIRISYKEVPPNPGMKRKIYGSAPVISAVVEFETIFLGIGGGEGEDEYSNFRKWMPAEVCDKFGIQCFQESEKSAEGEG